MSHLRFMTGGESHGPSLTVIIDGVPAGLKLSRDDIDRDLARRQGGHGRGGRMSIERDRARVTAGLRAGVTIGSPIAMEIPNIDHANWADVMHPWDDPGEAGRATGTRAPITLPRPGHADFAGALKFGHDDIRNVLERASARETAARVAAGAIARRLLAEFDIAVASHVLCIGGVWAPAATAPPPVRAPEAAFLAAVEASPVRCADSQASAEMMRRIDEASALGESVGGVFQVIAWGLPPGIGTYTQWDLRLDAALAQAVMSIPGVRGVEIGSGFRLAELPGTRAADEISRDGARLSNHGGGLEGGMTNGMPVCLSAVMKPINTMRAPLRSVELDTGRDGLAHYERADACAVPACAVVGEAMVAFVLADALLEKFGGDSIGEIALRLEAYRDEVARRLPLEP